MMLLVHNITQKAAVFRIDVLSNKADILMCVYIYL